MVIIPIDDLMRIVKDYLPAEDCESDMQVVSLMRHSSTQNIGIKVESAKWDSDLGEQRVEFELKRIYGVAG
jgi:hypothetical protein